MTHRPSAWGPFYPRYRKVRKSVVDAAAWAVLSPLALRRVLGARLPERPRSILVVALLKIGDTLTTLPTVAALKRRFPDARIGLWVSPRAAPLARLAEGVDVLFEGAAWRTARRIRAKGFEAAVVCSFVPQHLAWARAACPGVLVGYAYRGRGLFCDVAVPAPPQVGLAIADYPPRLRILHQTEVVGLLARPFGVEGPLPPPRLSVPPGDLPEGDGPRIALHIGNEQPHYRWPETRWADLARGLAESARARLWITGGPGDAEAAGRIKVWARRDSAVTVAAGQPLPETAALFAGMDLVVSVDTMATHLAAALGKPVVALFGPGAPEVWRPSGEGHAVLQNKSVCHGCRQPRCYRPAHECMEGISVEAVLAAARARLSAPRP